MFLYVLQTCSRPDMMYGLLPADCAAAGLVVGDGTAIVIPQAPEDTCSRSSSVSHQSSSPSLMEEGGDGGRQYLTPSPQSSGSKARGGGGSTVGLDNSEAVLPYKCELCEYRARWPSEMTQHMKNHSDEKPYRCPQCSYR